MGKQGGCSCCRLLSIGMSLAVIAAGGYAAWFFLGQPTGEEILDYAQDVGEKVINMDFGDFTDVLKNFTGFSPDFFNEDPYVGDNTTNVWVGHTKGEGGLYLELWNALDESWQNEYNEAVNDWNTNCNPKVLVLTSADVPVDNECTQADGVMKVCNGNYGETGWLGINEVLKSVPQGIIQSSVAKMNEHYLFNADYDERLYTMCHELGHGYGLPHTDENFNNQDMGNCLDYTNNPSKNLRPGVVNCNRLQEMYGTINIGRRRRRQQRRTRTTAAGKGDINDTNKERKLRYRSDAELYEDFFDDDVDADIDDENNEEEEDNDIQSASTEYNDDGRYYFEDAKSQYPNMSAEYEKAMEELYYDIAQGNIISPSRKEYNKEESREEEKNTNTEENDYIAIDVRGKWRCLREHPRGGDFSRKLNDGFILEVHVLFPNNKE